MDWRRGEKIEWLDASGWWYLGHVVSGTIAGHENIECFFPYDGRRITVAMKDIRAAQPGAREGGRRDETQPFAPTVPDPTQVARDAQMQESARREEAIGKVAEWHRRARKRWRWYEIARRVVSDVDDPTVRAARAVRALQEARRGMNEAANAIELMSRLREESIACSVAKGSPDRPLDMSAAVDLGVDALRELS